MTVSTELQDREAVVARCRELQSELRAAEAACDELQSTDYDMQDLIVLSRREVAARDAFERELQRLRGMEVPAHHIGQTDARAVDDRKDASTVHDTGHTCVCQDGRMPIEYLSLQGVADRLGVSRNSVAKYNLPEPDMILRGGKDARGWLPATIDAWDAARPGSGRWGARTGEVAELQRRTAELRERGR